MRLLPVLLLLLAGFGVSLPYTLAQQTIFGTVVDGVGDPVIGCNVKVLNGKRLLTGTVTDFDGNYRINLDAGIYDVEFSYVGYAAIRKDSIVVLQGTETNVDGAFEEGSSVTLEEALVTAYKVDPMRVDETSQGIVLHSRDVRRLGKRGEPRRRSDRKATRQFAERQPIARNESYGRFRENRFQRPMSEPLSTFGADVDVAGYANVRRFLNQGNLPPRDAVRVEEMLNYFTYDYPAPQGDDPVRFTTELTDAPWAPEHKLLHIGLRAKSLDADALPPSNLVFLIDVSGSMGSTDKLPLLKQGLQMLVKRLRAEDRVAIVVYAGAAGTVLESTPGSDQAAILDALDRLQSGGSTAGAAGLRLAYQIAERNALPDGNNRIILATDGDFNVGTTDNQTLEDYVATKRGSGIGLSVLGFGQDNYKDARMQVLAENGDGNAAYIDNLLEAQKVLVAEMGGTLHTIARDVKLQVEFNPARVAAYRLIGYESRLLNPEDFNDDTKDAGDMGLGHTVTALYEIVPVGSKSPRAVGTDALRYQSTRKKARNATDGEWATVRMKYKHPRGVRSQDKVETTVSGEALDLTNASENARWAAAVAGWGMLLSGSAQLDDWDYERSARLARGARGEDAQGYRAEAVRLIEVSAGLEEREMVEVGR